MTPDPGLVVSNNSDVHTILRPHTLAAIELVFILTLASNGISVVVIELLN